MGAEDRWTFLKDFDKGALVFLADDGWEVSKGNEVGVLVARDSREND